jgi:parallel beta helix pectate lyase-like protein
MRCVRLVVVLVALLAAPSSAAAHASRTHRPAHAPGRHRGVVHPKAEWVRSSRPAGAAHVASATIAGTTYYVSPNGSDSNSGTSPSQAWQTIARVNDAQLHPGDGVLFQGGQTFSDDTLMPNVSGTATAPIVFGSYGSGQATITMGVWFISHDYLTFENLRLGPESGFQGGRDGSTPADHITIRGCTISLSAHSPDLGVYSYGNDWTIEGTTIEQIGNSGMLLNGDSYLITGNTINNVGLDAAIPYGKHGIYLRVSNATVTHNTITNFSSEGISARFHNSTISDNYIADGPTAIGFFEYDPTAGTSHWTGNTIAGTSDAAIYVNGGSGGQYPTHESFVITGNAIKVATGQVLSLDPIHGRYQVRGNQ